MTGIDISNYQDGLDLAKARPGFVILKATEGQTLSDRCFSKFYDAARAAGIPCGAYVYSHATTPEQAKAEAAFVLHVIAGRDLPLGVFLDVEKPEQMQLSGGQLQETVLAFCTAIRAAGYRPGLYGSEYNLWAKLSISRLPADVIRWVAHYGKPPAISCDLWQSTDAAIVAGFSGRVDADSTMSQRMEDIIKAKPEKAEEPGIDWTVYALQSCMAHDGYWPLDQVNGVKTNAFREKFVEYAQDVGRC